MRAPAAIVLAAVLALVVLGASSGADPPAGAARAKRVLIGDNWFTPRKTRVRQGGRVAFVWRGRYRHDVYFYAAPRGAKPQRCPFQRRGRCTRRFRRPGIYRFVCTRHGSMVGKVRARRPQGR